MRSALRCIIVLLLIGAAILTITSFFLYKDGDWAWTLHGLSAIGEFLIALVIYLEVEQSSKAERVKLILEIYDRYAINEFFEARSILEKAPFSDLKSYREQFHGMLDEANAYRRRVKHLFARLGYLLEAGLSDEEEVFFVDLPYELWLEKLLAVERELLLETNTMNRFEARLDSVYFATRCAERYKCFLEKKRKSFQTASTKNV